MDGSWKHALAQALARSVEFSLSLLEPVVYFLVARLLLNIKSAGGDKMGKKV